MRAIIIISSCPQISVEITSSYGINFEVSVFCSETSRTCYPRDPAESARKDLSGTYRKEKLPPELIEGAVKALKEGSYNHGPHGAHFDRDAVIFFTQYLKPDKNSSQAFYGLDWEKIRDRIEQILRHPSTGPEDLLSVALAIGNISLD